MLKRYMCMFGVARYFHRESRKKKEIEEAAPMSMDVISSQQQDLSVRIIHAGGIVERYQGAVYAGRLLEKYPNMCIARPDVFKQPHDSVVRWDEYLLPGQKFYLVPQSTLKKLKRKYPEKLPTEDDESECIAHNKRKADHAEDGDEEYDDSVFSAKDFYVSGKRWSSRFLRFGMTEKRTFTPPIKKAKVWQGLAWQPSLDSVEELSP